MQKKLNEDFIDSYCEKFAAKVIESFFTDDKITITGKEILKVTPSQQTNLFVIKLIFQYWQGESRKLESPFFNYENEVVKEALQDFMNILSQNIEVHKNRFQLLLNNAVKDTIYLAASPQAYLEIDLDGADVDNIDDAFIEDNLKYIRIYKNDIKNFLSDMRGLGAEDAIDELADEFEPFSSTEGLEKEAKILSEILPLDPDKVLSENFPEDFDEFDDEVFDNDDLVKEESSSDLVDERSQDENDEDIAKDEPAEEEDVSSLESNEARFQAEEKVTKGLIHPGWSGKQSTMPESLKWGDEIDESSPKVEEEPGADQEMTEPFEDESFQTESNGTGDESQGEVVKDEQAEVEEKETKGEDEIDEEESGDWDEIENEPEDDEQQEKEETPKLEDESDEEKPEVETINDQFEVEEKTVAQHHEDEKSSSLMKLISVNHQYMFVKELFKDDQVSFQNALYDLEEYDSFDEAVEFLVQGYAKEFSWDMQSNEVKELLKVLFRKYRD